MRFLLTILIWIVFVGGLKLYTTTRDANLPTSPSQAKEVELAHRSYSLLLTPTFSVEEDPFALKTESTPSGTTGLELNLNGQQVTVSADSLSRGKTIRVDNIQGVQQGHNELYVKASPPLAENTMDQGIRIQVLGDNLPIVSETVWGEQGSLVSGTINFAVMDKEIEHGQQ